MKAFRHILVLVAVALSAASCGVSKIKDITLTSVGLQYIVPTSFRSMDAKLLLGIDNPAMGFTVTEVTGTLRYKDKPIANFVTGSLELQGKTEQVYEFPCSITLAEGASMLDVMVIASQRSLKNMKADVNVQAALKKNGVLRAPFTFKDVDLYEFSQ